ncbi:MAG: tetratricopeptide repeat protein [Pedobacter sp.]|nr:MAG: tetratricopeptide repeat protein [Pedobacter sp.]
MLKIMKLLKCFSLFILLVFIASLNASAQTSRVEELLGQLNKNNPDTTQIKIMRRLSAAYSAVDPIRKFYYANEYRLLGEKNGIDSVVSAGYIDMGISYGIRGHADSALHYFNLGHAVAKESNYELGVGRALSNIGYAYDRLDRKKEAVKKYEEALKIFRKFGVTRNINQCITNLGSIYFDLGEYKIADGYFRKVLENVKETPSDQMGLSNALFSLGNSNRKLKNINQALTYYREGLAIDEKLGNLNGIALKNWGIGICLGLNNLHKRSLEHFDIALKYNRQLKNAYQECAVLKSFADTYYHLKDYKTAEEYAGLALIKAKEVKSPTVVAEALDLLVDIHRAQKEYDEASKFQKDFINIHDTIDNVSKVKKDVIINDLNRVNSDNKNLEIDKRKNTEKIAEYASIISAISILLVVLAIVSVLYYRRNLEKKSANVLLQQQKQEIADINEELSALNEELTTQMDIISTQNVELEKLNQVKNKFFSIVSHDLRSPMNSLKMLFELFREGNLNKEELNKLTIRLEDTIQTTANFLDNLLEWSKNQLDGMTVNPTKVDVREIISDNIKLVDSQINFKSIRVENNIDQDTVVFADPDMINIVVRNLLSNAIKFCKEGDSISFDAKTAGDNVVISIRDTGPGINDNDKKNLFNLTHTVSSGTAGEKGYHIGLILCRDMVIQNQGSIELESKVGEGTVFYITLPKTV